MIRVLSWRGWLVDWIGGVYTRVYICVWAAPSPSPRPLCVCCSTHHGGIEKFLKYDRREIHDGVDARKLLQELHHEAQHRLS